MLKQKFEFLKQMQSIVSREENEINKIKDLDEKIRIYREMGYDDLAFDLENKIDKKIKRKMKLLTKLNEMMENFRMH